MTKVQIKSRLEYLRGEIKAERISQGEIAELQGLVKYIDPSDVELLEWGGVKENSYSSQEAKAIAVQALDEDYQISNADELTNGQLKDIIKLLSILVDGVDDDTPDSEICIDPCCPVRLDTAAHVARSLKAGEPIQQVSGSNEALMLKSLKRR